MTAAGRHALVFCGGDPVPDAAVVGLAPAHDVVAADSGAVEALRHGFPVDLVVGDLDSVPGDVLEQVTRSGAAVERHPSDKDATDLALAVERAIARGADRVTVVGGHGGRLDHLLANVAVLASDAFATVGVEARMGTARLLVVRAEGNLQGRVGEVVTLLAYGGPATVRRTAGLLFPLAAAVLEPGSSLGVSNQLTAPEATVEVAEGVVVAILPGILGPL